jgi:FAD/FMN-containing dehydrogenase
MDTSSEAITMSRLPNQGAEVLPTTPEDISIAVNIARENKIPFVVACGRHSTGAASSVEGGIVLDLRRMRKVSVDLENKTITAQGGCVWQDVDEAAAKYGLAMPGG